jgi:hypothetical protein
MHSVYLFAWNLWTNRRQCYCAKILEIENFNFGSLFLLVTDIMMKNDLKATLLGLLMGNALDSLKNKLFNLEVISMNYDDGS